MGPISEMRAGPTQECQHGSLACCIAQESLKREEEKDEKVMTEKDAQFVAEEQLKEVDLGSGSQESRPISISANLTEKEKLELVLLLKEFKDVFAWDYSEMPGLDPGLIAHMLNVDRQAKPVAQPARIFHTEIEGQIVKEVQKLLYRRMLGGVLSRCVGRVEAQRKLKDVHDKNCGSCGEVSPYCRLQRASFYWPSMGKKED